MHFRVSRDGTGRVLVVGSVNLDTGYSVERLPREGETITSTGAREGGGGKGANQALAAQQLGAAVSLLACVGRDGDRALEDLAAAGVDLGPVVRLPDALTGRAVLLVTPSDNAIVVHPGANALLTATHVTDHAAHTPAPRVVILQHEIPHEVVAAAVRAYRGRALVVLNPSPYRELDDDTRAGIDLLVVNHGELSDLLGRDLPEEPGELAEVLADAPPGDIVVTLGPHGALVRHGTTVTPVRPVPVDAVDTVGAGDTFLGALAAQLAQGVADLPGAVRHAVAAATLAVTTRGARNPDLSPTAVHELLAATPGPEGTR
ncbi:ribokinase [Actinomycetes bacterium KLBMP 9759]